MTEPLLVIHNPRSRLGRRAAESLQAASGPTASAGARWAEGRTWSLSWATLEDLEAWPGTARRVAVIGGDGTINAAASWLDRRGMRAEMAIVPAGTGNNLARGLGVPLETDAAWRLALEGAATRRIDAVAYRAGEGPGERLFIQTGALGFPAEVAEEYDRLRQRPVLRALLRPLGPLAYRLLALRGIARQKGRDRRGEPPLELTCDLPGESLRERAIAVFLGNERSLGGNFVPCPRAALDDGLLDICVVRAAPRAGYLKLFASVGRGEHLGAEGVIYRQSPGPLRLTLSRPGGLLADGDIWVREARYDLRVRPGLLEVVVPPLSAAPAPSAGPVGPVGRASPASPASPA